MEILQSERSLSAVDGEACSLLTSALYLTDTDSIHESLNQQEKIFPHPNHSNIAQNNNLLHLLGQSIEQSTKSVFGQSTSMRSTSKNRLALVGIGDQECFGHDLASNIDEVDFLLSRHVTTEDNEDCVRVVGVDDTVVFWMGQR
jgi:hypothetical protein